MRAVLFEPVDTWFFRDGTPYSVDTGPQIDVGGSFPPSPFSMAGALRAALAMARGWTGTGRWPKEFNATLGDGPDDLGQLRLCGPLVFQTDELLFPVPRHLWRTDDELGFAQPGAAAVCDLGAHVPLPAIPERASLVPRTWITQETFEAVLEGRPPRPVALVDTSTLWREEPRVGIQRNPTTRTVAEGMLYSSRHFRLLKGTALLAGISGLPEDWPVPTGAYPFGGESRLAYCKECPVTLRVKMPLDRICAEGRFVLIALTPLDLSREVCLGEAPITELANARVVSACMDRPVRVGGWDSLSRQPRPLRSYVAPGTAFFCKCGDRAGLRAAIEELLKATPLPSIGGNHAAGFGCVALGAWVEDKEQA